MYTNCIIKKDKKKIGPFLIESYCSLELSKPITVKYIEYTDLLYICIKLPYGNKKTLKK